MAVVGNIGKLKRLFSQYNLNVVFQYLEEACDPQTETHKRIFSLPVGAFEKYYITEEVFALEQVFKTKHRNDCFFEAHKRYIDFQLCLAGTEQMELIDVDRLDVKQPYDEKKDLITYKTQDDTSKIVLRKNDLAVYFPFDAHMGLPHFDNKESLVYKTVLKLPVKYLHV